MGAAGVFLLATGDVQVRDTAGALRAAKTGTEINSGETILTRNGRAQVSFTDSGQISMQPGTEFKIDDFRFREAGKQEESAVFSLIKGGVRAITGLIGRRSKPDYVMSTVVATIGIRGTEFQAILCASSCNEPDGLYVQTGEGVVFVRNALGEIDLERGQTAFVASPQSAPQRTSAGPSMTSAPALSDPPPVPGVSNPEFDPGTILTTNPFGAVTVLSSAGIAAATSGSGSITFNGTTYSSANIAGAGSGAGTNTRGDVAVPGAYINGSQVNGFVVYGNGVFGSITFDNVLNSASSGDLYWGRWSAGTVSVFVGLNGIIKSDTATIPPTVNLHYILGTSVPTIPTSGMATYNFVGGTPSTDLAGTVGSGITSGTVTADFLNSSVGANFMVNHGGAINVVSTMPMNSGNRAAFSSANGGGHVNIANSTVAGFFVGAGSPAGAGLSYSINNNVAGVGAFR